MKQYVMTSALFAISMSQLACAGTANHPDPRVAVETNTATCEPVRSAQQSAWFHGQGAPAGQAMIGHEGSMENLHAKLSRQEVASANGESCGPSGSWSQVR